MKAAAKDDDKGLIWCRSWNLSPRSSMETDRDKGKRLMTLIWTEPTTVWTMIRPAGMMWWVTKTTRWTVYMKNGREDVGYNSGTCFYSCYSHETRLQSIYIWPSYLLEHHKSDKSPSSTISHIKWKHGGLQWGKQTGMPTPHQLQHRKPLTVGKDRLTSIP